MSTYQAARSLSRSLILGCALLALTACNQPMPNERALRVVATEMQFAPSTISAEVGDLVFITLVNEGQIAHNLLIDLPSGTRQVAANDGVDAVLSFPANEAGSFRFYCSIPGHEAMEGRLEVVAGN
jgi:plastocyanin